MTKTILAIGLAVLMMASWLFFQAERPTGLLPYRDAAITAHGRIVYDEHCAACHGAELEGEPNWRRMDAEGFLPAPPHDATGHTWHHPDEQLLDITLRGSEQVVGGGYQSRMPGFSDVLSRDEAIAVLAYIKSTWPAEIIDRHDQINANASGS